jgi:hypothetical protein
LRVGLPLLDNLHLNNPFPTDAGFPNSLACFPSDTEAFVFNLDEPLRTKKRLAAKRPPGDEPSG